MAYNLNEINRRALADPAGFVRECDAEYDAKIKLAADMIIKNRERSPIVLISGPSGSGKTTTSKKIEEELRHRGIMSHAIAMDSYFITVDPETAPRTPEGTLDLESPQIVDLDLMNKHFDMLARGETVDIPKYSFSEQRRLDIPSVSIKLGHDDIAVVEGIHALNDMVTSAHPEAFKLYISARSNVERDNGEVCFKGTWMRLVRRVVRDKMFRGAAADYTLGMWANVRRGEKHNISPFKDKADLKFDSSFPYEVSVMRAFAEELFQSIPEDVERCEEFKCIFPALQLFEPIDAKYLLPDSLLCEFVGGGKYSY